ncbi:unnamed protein product [Mytilus edulis]|uniref:DZIP3-like HEPN domain-containing protein n=1 Tax=Mytilus edulis TaxID=6550 RepID=A0A8S3SV47_MYTED|nr:unnamed protein product [Mytilus edulis]
MVVLDTYPRMITEIISNQWPPKLVFKLTQNEKDQSFMRKITPLQRQMISKLDTSGYINLDVSCIYKLIRHFNLLPVPKQGWGNKPSIHDTQEGDDVERMKIYRNDILHRPRGGLSEQEGKHFFQESYEMAKRLDISIGSPMNGFESKIKAIQCFSVDRQKYVEALEKCAEYQDDDVQDLEFLLEKPLPILKLNVNVLNSAFQNENILYKEVNRFVTGMYDAMDNNRVPINGSQREVMMLTGPEKDLKEHLKKPYMDALQDNVIDVNTDYHWRRFIMELCYGQIVKNVIPSGLLPNLEVIFSNDYQWLVDFIEGDWVNYEDTHTWELLINVFQKTLSANIKPHEILPYLKEKSVISDKDLAEVEQMCKLYGENVAVFQLLTYLPKCKHNAWYPEFKNILYENGYSYVVKEIDRENYESKETETKYLNIVQKINRIAYFFYKYR